MGDKWAFLFADVVRSTRLRRCANQKGYPLQKIKDEVRRIFRTAVEENGGRHYSGEWDEFRSVFPHPESAVQSACQIAQEVRKYRETELQKQGIQCVSLHYCVTCGEAERNKAPPGRPYEEDYGGYAVEIASRLVKLARPDQILLSKEAVASLETSKTPITLLKPRLKYCGLYSLKGIGWKPIFLYCDKNFPLNSHPPPWSIRHRIQVTLSAFLFFLLLGSGLYWWYEGSFNPKEARINGQTVILRDGPRIRTISLLEVVKSLKGKSYPTAFDPQPRFPDQMSKDGSPNWEILNSRHLAHEDLNGDGIQEVIVLTETMEQETSALLLAMKPDGRVLWQPPDFQELVRVNDEDPRGFFQGLKVLIDDLNLDGKPEIVAMLNVHGWEPSLIAVIASDGKVLQRYYHYGGLNDFILADIDGDGKSDVVFCGINNTRVNENWEPLPAGALRWHKDKRYYWGAVAGAFSIGDFSLASSPQPEKKFYLNEKEIPQTYGIFYARFPLSDWSIYANDKHGYWNQCNMVWETSRDSLQFIIQEQDPSKEVNRRFFGVSYFATFRREGVRFTRGVIHGVKRGLIESACESGELPRCIEEMERALTPILLRP